MAVLTRPAKQPTSYKRSVAIKSIVTLWWSAGWVSSFHVFAHPYYLKSAPRFGAGGARAEHNQDHPIAPFLKMTSAQPDENTQQDADPVDEPSVTMASDPNQNKEGTWNPLRLAVLKLGITELRFTSPLNYEKQTGEYRCAGCGALLFKSDAKYDSGSGWPSFFKTASDDAVQYKREWDDRIECRCKKCDGHLGHVFGDGPRREDMPESAVADIPETDPQFGRIRLPRFCINGASLKFTPKD